MSTLIIGANGQLGSELCKLIPHAKVIAHTDLDISDSNALKNKLEEVEPELIFNCAALTNVDKCQSDKDAAYHINSVPPKVIAAYCIKNNARVVQFSTDYVFDGEKGMYTEEDIPNPINYYGLSKLLGDFAIFPLENSLIIRTSGVFGEKMNFPRFVYSSLKEGKEVVAIDSFYSPISAKNLAKASFELEIKGLNGIINVAGERVSRYNMALEIADFFSLDKTMVKRSKEMPKGIARRPFDSSMDISKAKSLLDWDFYTVESNISILGH